MSLPNFSGGTLINTLIAADTAADIVANLKDQLVLAGWSATASGSGWNLTSAKTDDNFRCRLDLQPTSPGSSITGLATVWLCDEEFTHLPNTTWGGAGETDGLKLQHATSRQIRVYANRYGFFTCLDSGIGDGDCDMQCGAMKLEAARKAPVIVSATNSGGEFLVTTATDHNLQTGDNVFIAESTKSGGTTMPALNGPWTVTIASDTTYTLDGSIYEAGYDASSGISAGNNQISRLMFQWGGDTNGTGISMRNEVQPVSQAGQRQISVGVYNNDVSTGWNANQQNAVQRQIIVPKITFSNLVPPSPDSYYDIVPLRLAWGLSTGGAFRSMGYVYNAAWGGATVDIDKVPTPFDGQSWITYSGSSSYGTLLLITA